MRASSSSARVASPASIAPTHTSVVSLDASPTDAATAAARRASTPPQSQQRRRSVQRQSAVEARPESVVVPVESDATAPQPSTSTRHPSLRRSRRAFVEEDSGPNRSPSTVGQIPQKGSLGRSARSQRLPASTAMSGSPQRLSTSPPPQQQHPSFQGESSAHAPPPQTPPPSPLPQTRPSTPRTDAHLHPATMAERREDELSAPPAPTPSPDDANATEVKGTDVNSGGGGTSNPTSGNPAASTDTHCHQPSTAAPTAAVSTDTHDHHHNVHPHHHHGHPSPMFMSDPGYGHHHHHHTKYTEESENDDKDKGMRNRSQCHHDDESCGATSRGSSSEGVPGPCSAAGPSGRTVTRLLIVGWDKIRTRIMIALLVIFAVWVCIFFPLLGQM